MILFYGVLGADYLWGDGVNEQSIKFNQVLQKLNSPVLDFVTFSSEQLQSLECEISSSDPVNAVEITELEAVQSTTQQIAKSL